MICAALPAQAQELRLLSDFVWDRNERWFGGFSGIEITDNGQTLTVISDRGRVITARLIRESGHLRRIEVANTTPLRGPDGRRLTEHDTDAEGLSTSVNGQFLISFENHHRIMTLDPITGQTSDPLHLPRIDMEDNAGFEALALHPDGTLYTLPEETAARSGGFPLFAYRDGEWKDAGQIPRQGPFLPVGADFDATGRLYLLERTLSPLGFRSRIRRFTLTAPDLAPKTLLISGPGRFDNMEGLSVWTDISGQTHLTMIADDNFLPIEKTQIVEFSISD